jgi:hypothetical protein
MTNDDKMMNVAALEGTHTWLHILGDSVRRVVDDVLCLVPNLSSVGCCDSRRLNSADLDILTIHQEVKLINLRKILSFDFAKGYIGNFACYSIITAAFFAIV